jgi:hypothetical protein
MTRPANDSPSEGPRIASPATGRRRTGRAPDRSLCKTGGHR